MLRDNIEFSYICYLCSICDLPFGTDAMEMDGEAALDDHHDNYTDPFHDHNQTIPDISVDHFECFSRKGIHFWHLNARSLPSKISEIRLLASKSKAAVLSVTETWLGDTFTDDEVKIDGYALLRNGRSRTGVGVCTYARTDLTFNFRMDLHSDEHEAL